ncbi:unnamed protein product [Strongylus vulgaris]|uniref:Uncharacterized protein n=1 Tax=Strongylus vulgaris TaxID=40348 RepID=A0A3P7IPY6_STRVU|nr:unnamed protein product [Strongylus vulgaris]
MTHHSAYLCDDRFPKDAVLTLPHTIPYGGHVLYACTPISDNQGSGEVVSVYLLDHLLTGVWVSRLYYHDCKAWSSILPIHALEDYHDFGRLVKPIPGSFIRDSHPTPTNGMAVVQGFEDIKGRKMQLLLRSFNSGEVYYQTMRYGCIDDVELKKFWIESQRRLIASQGYAENNDVFKPTVPESKESISVSITVSDEDFKEISAASKKRRWNPLQKRVYKNCTPLEPLQPLSSKAVLPQVINDVWHEAMSMG